MAKYRHNRMINMYGIAVEEHKVKKGYLRFCIILELMQSDLKQLIYGIK